MLPFWDKLRQRPSPCRVGKQAEGLAASAQLCIETNARDETRLLNEIKREAIVVVAVAMACRGRQQPNTTIIPSNATSPSATRCGRTRQLSIAATARSRATSSSGKDDKLDECPLRPTHSMARSTCPSHIRGQRTQPAGHLFESACVAWVKLAIREPLPRLRHCPSATERLALIHEHTVTLLRAGRV